MDIAELWHFPRPELARQYLQLLTAGLVSQTTIFAPRRAGKTRFLVRDLKPAAEAEGFTVAYADLWQTNEPALSLLRALETASEPQGAAERVMAVLRSPVRRLKAKAGTGGVSGEFDIEFTDPKKAATEIALRIDELMGELSRRKKVLLLVDEAQTLARDRTGEQLARSLRTALTKHVETVRVVFTGSSRTQLANVFSNAHAPLYSAGHAVRDFPLLGPEFVHFICTKFKAATKRTLPFEAALAAHERFLQRPEALMFCVLSMVLEPSLTLEEAERQENERQAAKETHDGLWLALDDLQRHLVRQLAMDPGFKPFAKATLEAVAKQLGVGSLHTTQVQRAMTALAASTVVTRTPRGTWEFENEAFRAWVAALPEEPH